MDIILGECTLTRRRKKLDERTKGGLGVAYTETLSRIKALDGSRSQLGMQVLMWVSHAERPLHVDELCHALGVQESPDLDSQDIPAIATVLACSLGLVTVEKSSSTVRLVHYTLQEHLSNNANFFSTTHSTIAEVCLTYLNFPHVRGFPPTLRSVPSTAPFVEYASCYWGTHARLGTTESVKTLALKLLDGYDKHISSKMMLLHRVSVEEQPFDIEDTPIGFTGLHGATYFGCLEITVALLEANKGDVQATDLCGNRAIDWASKGGHAEVARVLLERGDINSDTSGREDGSRPLLSAAEGGHEGVVKLLLEQRDVDPDKPDKQGRAPLSWASGNGHEGVVKMLLERNDVSPDKPDLLGLTPLSQASQNGHEGVVRMLLERNDVNPNHRDFSGLTPLSQACHGGHEEVARMLLERNDANPNQRDRSGLTPLSQACHGGHEGVVRMLLERDDVNPDAHGWGRITPLMCASINGHEGIVRMLLERNGVNPNQRALLRETPLMCASMNGHEGIVRMLLERNGVNPKHLTLLGETALSLASGNEHWGVVRMLMEKNEANARNWEPWGQKLLRWTSWGPTDAQ